MPRFQLSNAAETMLRKQRPEIVTEFLFVSAFPSGFWS